jgi:hypothetical protein
MPDGHKKVFISWSKAMSKRVASVLQEYLPEVLEGVDLFMSDKDIEPGQRSMKVLESQLDGTTYGLLVVTAENQGESWLNFEAGALSKQVGKDEDDIPRVVPLLVDINNPNQLTGPVSQFQAVRLDKEGLRRTILSIATLVGSKISTIEKRFERAWPDMETAITEAKQDQLLTKKPSRSVDSKIDEALQILRTMQRRQSVNSLEGKSSYKISPRIQAELDGLAEAYGLSVTRIDTNSDGLVELVFHIDKVDTPMSELKSFEREARKIVGPGHGIVYVSEAQFRIRDQEKVPYIEGE